MKHFHNFKEAFPRRSHGVANGYGQNAGDKVQGKRPLLKYDVEVLLTIINF